MIRRAISALFLLLLMLLAPARAEEPDIPNLVSYANDPAGIIPPEDESRLDNKLAYFWRDTGRQVVFVTVPDLQGYNIEDYGIQLARKWRIGRKGLNDGVILIVAPKERKVRIEVGYGVEGTLTDGMSWLIIQQKIVPKFKDGDMVGGIEAGLDGIMEQLKLSPEEAARLAKEADAAKAKDEEGSGTGWLVLVGVIVFFFAIVLFCSRNYKPQPYARAQGGKRSRRSDGGVVLWGSSGSDSSWSSSSSSDWSSGSDFGGGGGGDFGGGGASGDW
jgi:uncharacterized protein